MKTIVAAVDFSAISVNAAFYAADLAVKTDSDIVLFHSYTLPPVTGESPLPSSVLAGVAADARHDLAQLAREISAHTSHKVTVTSEIREGALSGQLTEYCTAHPPFLIIMGARGASSRRRFLFGSQVTAAIGRLPWPLLVIPPNASFKNIGNIGLACNLQDIAANMPVAKITGMVSLFHAHLYIVNVTHTRNYDAHKDEQAARALKLFSRHKPGIYQVHHASFAEGIDQFCKEFSIDMLIIVPEEHSFLEQLLHPSHSARVLNAPAAPLLFIRNDP